MKLIDNVTAAVIDLPDDLMWTDELEWVALVATKEYSLTGSLVVQQAVKLSGRPISLEASELEMGWVTREVAMAVIAAASIPNRKFTLMLEYPTDTRSFIVLFDNSEKSVEAHTVKGFPEHELDAYYKVKIKLIEVPA